MEFLGQQLILPYECIKSLFQTHTRANDDSSYIRFVFWAE